MICEEWTWNKALKTPYDWLVSIQLWNKANRGKYKINVIDSENIETEYYKGQTQLKEEPIAKKLKNYNPDYPYWKVLKCPHCEWHLTAERSKSKSVKYHHYYSCRWKKGIKHKNYSLRRDEINDEIVDIFNSIKFDKEILELFNFISEKVYENIQHEDIQKNNYLSDKINELKTKKTNITSNIGNLLDYPDLLKAQNTELQTIKFEIKKLKFKQKEKLEVLWLEKFKKSSQKILTHLDKLVLQKETPEVIQLAFSIIFNWKVEYEKLKSHTPINSEFMALNTKKKELQVNWNSSLNCKWWETNKSYHTLKEWVIKLIDIIEKYQYIIDKIKL